RIHASSAWATTRTHAHTETSDADKSNLRLFSYEVVSGTTTTSTGPSSTGTSETWLVAGRRKGTFTSQEDGVVLSEKLRLVPLVSGEVAMPVVDIRSLAREDEAGHLITETD